MCFEYELHVWKLVQVFTEHCHNGYNCIKVIWLEMDIFFGFQLEDDQFALPRNSREQDFDRVVLLCGSVNGIE